MVSPLGSRPRRRRIIPRPGAAREVEKEGAGDVFPGPAAAEYVALEGKPLAWIATAAIYWVHGDHLGTPQMLADAAGAAVWDATYRPPR